MCGICGLFGLSNFVNPLRLKLMTSSLEHRGPDHESYYYTSNIAFGFRRLAIVDVTGGSQPLTNETQHIHVLFNGEIYNYKEIRRDLQNKGHDLRQAGDGEVIPHLYEEYGLTFPTKLRGTFAIALWDERRRRLMLARDRLGVKPLYVRYGSEYQGLAFASELKALLIGENTPEIDIQALDMYLSYRYVPAPSTIFKGIFKVNPGSTLIAYFTNHQIQIRSHFFWQPPEGRWEMGFEDASFKVRDALTEALRIRWPEEVPGGYFFSGGLDSAGLVALHNAYIPEQARTYAVGFEQPKRTRDFRYYSELEQARAAARLLKTKHHERIVTLDEVSQLLAVILGGLDEPIADPTAIPLYFLSEYAAFHGEKVVFSGEGADELFGGYSTYLEPGNYRRYNNLPEWIKRMTSYLFPERTARFSMPLRERYFGVGGLLKTAQKADFYTEEMNNQLRINSSDFPARIFLDSGRYSEEERMLRFDLVSWLPENTLMKADKMTMLHSLEMRLPYLDHFLVELGVKLPVSFKVDSSQGKRILRAALKEFLPKEIRQRPKNGFPVPITAWLAEELKEEMRNVLLDRKARVQDYIQSEKLEMLLKESVSSRSARLIWALYSLEVYLADVVRPSNLMVSSHVRHSKKLMRHLKVGNE